jgi:hypothetical protein
LPKKWPLGIDRIKELWDSNAEGRLLAFLCGIAKDYEPRNNLSQYLVGYLGLAHSMFSTQQISNLFYLPTLKVGVNNNLDEELN